MHILGKAYVGLIARVRAQVTHHQCVEDTFLCGRDLEEDPVSNQLEGQELRQRMAGERARGARKVSGGVVVMLLCERKKKKHLKYEGGTRNIFREHGTRKTPT